MRKERLTAFQSDLVRRMFHGAFWSFSGTAMGKLCLLVAGILCAHLLKQEVFGQLGMIRSTLNIFIVFGASGIGVTATKLISTYRTNDIPRLLRMTRLTFRLAWVMALVLMVFCFVLAQPIARHILHAGHLTFELQIASVLLLFSILYGVQNGVLTGLEQFKIMARNTFIGSLLEAVLMVAGAYFWGLTGAIVGLGIGLGALFWVNRLSIRKHYAQYVVGEMQSIRTPNDWSMLLNDCIPATLSALMVTPTFWGIRTILLQHDGYNSLALFGAADQWKVMMLFIPTAISQMVLPILTSIRQQRQQFRHVLLANIALIVGISSMITLVVLLLGGPIMQLYGKGFSDKMPLVYLALSNIFSAYSNIIEMSIYSKNKMWQAFVINLFWAIVLLVSAYGLVERGLNATGIALAVLIAYGLKSILATLYLTLFLKR